MALKGTLEDFGIAEIFQLIAQQKKTGRLILTRKQVAIEIHFKQGMIVRALDQAKEEKAELGQMMVRAGLIQEQELEDALNLQKQTLKPVGDTLVSMAAIQQEDLDEMLTLQHTELIFKLFRWQRGSYEFISKTEDEMPSHLTRPLGAEFLLMEGMRILDEWPSVWKKVRSFDAVFKVTDAQKPIISGAGEDEIEGLDDMFEEEGSGSSSQEGTRVTKKEHRIFERIDGQTPVKRIIAASRLGEFETCKGLASLLDKGLIDFVSIEFKPSPEKQSYLKQKRTGLGYLSAVYAAMAGGILLMLSLGFTLAKHHPSQWAFSRSVQVNYEDISRMRRVQMALPVYFLHYGFYPQNLGDLAESGLVSAQDLEISPGSRLSYRPGSSKFELSLVLP